MEWERAKSLILLLFVLLNLTLGVLIFREERKYIITPEREQAITTIMHENNITMETRMIRSFQPMRELTVSGFYYNVDALLNIFFDNPAAVVRDYFHHGYEFIYGDAELVISRGFVSYFNPNGLRGEAGHLTELTRMRAEALTDAFVQAYWPDFELDDVYIARAGDWMRLSYRQVYRGYIIHTNFIELVVTNMGIEQVDMQFSQVIDFGHEWHIAAPDEVLLTFVQRVRGMELDSPITITHMDLVFFQDEASPDPAIADRAVPFYRIFIDGNGGDPFLINAVTNQILN